MLLATTASFGLVSSPAQAASDRPEFYEPPATLPAGNGDVIRAEPSVFHLDPFRLIEADADVHRIMYRSTDGAGEPIAVTGTVVTPRAAWTGGGERPLVGYAVGTQGLGDHCAPSRQLAAGTEYEGLFVKGLLLRGYAVVLTDYEGLGTPGDHTYVNRAVSGQAVLDSVRAAQRLPEAGIADDGPVAITGYSQGGGAAAAAAELAPAYAPELDLRGVAAGAVPTDLNAVAETLDGSLYAGFLGYAVSGLAAGAGIDPAPYLNDRGERFVEEAKRYCTIEAVARHAFTRSSRLTASGEPLSEYLRQPLWKAVVDEQRIGDRRPTVPTLVTHSLLDDVIPYRLGRNLASDWCARGATVEFSWNLGPTHVGGAVAAYPKVFTWLGERFAGERPRSTC
ncbi:MULTISPECIES: lipase family protein [unclassified Streptomyces]|uniref:lipase family protein n=1 Tax=unclassified Streptomyces TaxID=2593676 RepID=UPI0022B74D59|nr:MULTISPECIES: lipase family protein [unclassified Streptomyces]MCZ7415371.1 alpha/beta fold hydrolase [Streptomyces sp. WMMC897]MCZ7432293.1 alpha/beta fold hydrolase [Streptomyces sp. WMMC1477]